MSDRKKLIIERKLNLLKAIRDGLSYSRENTRTMPLVANGLIVPTVYKTTRSNIRQKDGSMRTYEHQIPSEFKLTDAGLLAIRWLEEDLAKESA